MYHCSQVYPDNSTMKHKYISTQSNEVLFHFSNLGKDCFSTREALNAFPDTNKSTVRELLSDMTKRGLLMRLKEGMYYKIPYEEDSNTFIPQWHLITKCLVGDIEHYVGYYSALQVHNLITQPSLNEQVVVAQQIKPSKAKVRNIEFQFIYHNTNHFFGSKKIWLDSFNKVSCSDLEKTIIDCLFKPEYAGGIVEIAKAIYLSKEKIEFDKLLHYTIQFNSQSVIKRLGFILELLEVNTNIIPALLNLKTSSYTRLDTELPKFGKMISRWSIQQNIDTETIKSALYT